MHYNRPVNRYMVIDTDQVGLFSERQFALSLLEGLRFDSLVENLNGAGKLLALQTALQKPAFVENA